MADLWSYIKGLFKEAEESSPSNPAVHEIIKRTDSEREDFEFWKKTLVCRRMLDWLSHQYALFQVLPDDVDEALDFLNTPSSKGFVIHFHKTRYSLRDVTHLLDYLKEKVQGFNYRVQVSDSRTFSRYSWVENVQRHYLKPRINFEVNEQINQQYGNITIDATFRNDQPYQLRFRATAYTDNLYKKADAFKYLMQQLL